MPSKFRFRLFPLAALTLLLGLNACTESEEEDPEGNNPDYTIPASYSAFEKVDFSGQTTRLDMLEELGAYVKSANKPGTKIEAAKMKAMFANEGNPFSKEALNTATSKQLRDKTFEPHRPYFDSLFEAAEAASQDTAPGAKGKAGLVTAGNGSKYLMSAKGHEYGQLIEKGLMGALAFYQAANGYLDSTTKLAPGLADSVKAHHWDEAYGYFSSSTTFPEEEKSRFWSKYAKSMDEHIGSNAKLLRAFVKGRAAIVNADRKTMLEAIDSVRYEWERVSAACAVHYLNGAKKSITDDGARNHQLSEAIAFVRALQYNPAKKITAEQLAKVEEHVGSDFYEVTQAGLDAAIDLLSGIYGFDDVKSKL